MEQNGTCTDVVLSLVPLQMHEVVFFWPRGLHSLLDAACWPPEVLDAYFRPVISSGEAWEVRTTCKHLLVPAKRLVCLTECCCGWTTFSANRLGAPSYHRGRNDQAAHRCASLLLQDLPSPMPLENDEPHQIGCVSCSVAMCSAGTLLHESRVGLVHLPVE